MPIFFNEDSLGRYLPRIARLHPSLEHAIIKPVDLSGAEEAQVGDAREHVDETLGREVRSCHVQLLDRRLLPLHLHHVLRLETWKTNLVNWMEDGVSDSV